MQCNAGDCLASGNLRKFPRSGYGIERKISAEDFSCALRLDSEHGAVGSGSQIRRGAIGCGSDELIGGAGTPHSKRTDGRSTERNKNSIARARALDERRSSESGDLRLRRGLNRWRTCSEIHLRETGRTSAGRAILAAETDED